MTKILVADDNSNIQRTVVQALSHLNTEVVTVNNGQAAVRKVSEISPDLVLADIFMPVRNGYEVCEFVKKNPSTSHVPVILMAGAFDPLDEREAQRVGADGILKKPFVPPDPLVNMVQTLLDRLAAMKMGHGAVINSSAAATGTSRRSGTASVETAVEEEPLEHPIAESAKHTGVVFVESEQPLAFGSLLEAPAAEPDSPAAHPDEPHHEPTSTGGRTDRLGSPNFWRDEAAPFPELPDAHSSATAAPPLPSQKEPRHQDEQEHEKPPVPDVHAEGIPVAKSAPVVEEESSEPLRPIEPHELVREEPEEMEVASSSIVDEEPIVLDPSKYASLTVDPGVAPELAKNPLDWMASAPSREIAPEAAASEPESEPAVETPEPASSLPMTLSTEKEAESEPERASVDRETASERHAAPAELAASPLQGEDEEIEEYRRELARLTAPPATESQSIPAPASTAESLQESSKTPASPDAALLQHDFPTVAHQDAHGEPAAEAHVQRVHSFLKSEAPAAPAFTEESEPVAANRFAESHPVAADPETSNCAYAPAEVVSAASEALAAVSKAHAPAGRPDSALVDAVVQRVLEKMKPEVVDIITKEFLHPLVQALVSREIEKH